VHQSNTHLLAELGGVETVTLTINQIPAHSHVPQVSAAGAATSPAGNVWANSPALQFAPPASPLLQMNAGVMTTTGGGQPHDNMLPFQALNFVICLVGIFPTQS
jgi:microcystin-dependent protein